ncbi:glycine zipper 2TM domain-containing protein [Albitalea terrae]|uniref:Glycine zipper 2TM domain-containing protein n=2 Tax=Piscinibacter terrae TaxID=2496871 RepID=A0A3N7HLM4_9BURK|nr:glycine zipper 2TM domain-containing protein [Albitalea terrae]
MAVMMSPGMSVLVRTAAAIESQAGADVASLQLRPIAVAADHFRSSTMKRMLSAIACSVSLIALAAPAMAADTAKTQADQDKTVAGVKLSSLCDGCGVVSNAHTETRKGKASGVGAVGGAVAGGVVGHQLGGGSGKTALTVLGAVGGGLAGNEVEKNMKKYTVWVTTVTFKDGTKKRYEAKANPDLKSGDLVKIDNGHPVKKV